MKPEKHDYEFPVHGERQVGRIGEPAGVYWLDGRCTIAAYDSPAERALLEAGAVQVATLLFERDPLEGSHGGRTVERIGAATALREFGAAEGEDRARRMRVLRRGGRAS